MKHGDINFCAICGCELKLKGRVVSNNRAETARCLNCDHDSRRLAPSLCRFRVDTGFPTSLAEQQWMEDTQTLWRLFVQREPYPPKT